MSDDMSDTMPSPALSRRAVLIGGLAMVCVAGTPPIAQAAAAPPQWDVLATSPLPIKAGEPLPDGQAPAFPPITATLIYGARDAVLVDGFLTVAQGDALADWIKAHGKNLTTIYATHAHPDHFFGAGTVLQRFPHARFVAMPNVVEKMRGALAPQVVATAWRQRFPSESFDHLVIAEPLERPVIDLEGAELVVVPLGHTDTDDTTCLHVRSAGLVVAGDAVYNGVHLFLADSNPQKRRDWIAALDKIEALKPRAVIAGHKRPGAADDPRIIEETRQYIRDFDRLVETSASAAELYDRMLALYPDRVNPNALRIAARAAKKG
jgi:glyoxylase-like metal-dependent hydrolase (beta-lactamase superfamily II)